MDAGLAAVLGAIVGAIGTGGGAVAAAVLGRSQARMQLQAEHQRALREPRKAAYVAYAEGYREAHDLFQEAVYRLKVRESAAEDRSGLLRDEARGFYEQGVEKQETLGHLEAVIYVEGPAEVRGAVITAGNALQKFRGSILNIIFSSDDNDSVRALAEGADDGDLVEEAEDRAGAAYRSYLDFLYAASDALGANLLGLR